jgi:hypothetical protein
VATKRNTDLHFLLGGGGTENIDEAVKVWYMAEHINILVPESSHDPAVSAEPIVTPGSVHTTTLSCSGPPVPSATASPEEEISGQTLTPSITPSPEAGMSLNSGGWRVDRHGCHSGG